uniref:SHC SH2 domain-binding protein 1 isoform X4 n=1 Tax=Callithrix jacchus TaxID=9483 RepID=UPI00159F62F8|nr:SHC SH2 domain-binding protein 1 isoform X4 [Callithrix jacchus]
MPEGKTLFPEIFQTNQLLFYEPFRAYQDYILADCKASEVNEFTADFLETVLETCGWRAVRHTNVFKVLVEAFCDFPALQMATFFSSSSAWLTADFPGHLSRTRSSPLLVTLCHPLVTIVLTDLPDYSVSSMRVTDVDFAALKAVVRLAEPYFCDSQVSTFTMECMKELLDLKEHKLPLQELWVVFDDLGVFDQTALAIEHVRDDDDFPLMFIL